MGTPRVLGGRKLTLEEETIRVCCDIPVALHQRLVELARQDRRSLAQEIITLIERSIEKQPEDSIPELLLAIQNIQQMIQAQTTRQS